MSTKKLGKRAPQTTWKSLYIVEWCEYRGLSQVDLAKRSGLSESLISQLIAGRTNGGPDSLEKIAFALGIPLGYLFDVEPHQGGRWVRYWVPAQHLTTFHTMVTALGARAGKIEQDL